MKRIITLQDVSCVGRCSVTVALPIISACGVETAVLPTALLSTHTGFPKFTFMDLTDQITPISDTFKELGMEFDGIYTGYLGSLLQVEIVGKFISDFKRENNFVLVDPAMADNGKLYKGFDMNFAKKMSELCGKADLIIPNLTEASFMLGLEYRENYDEDYIKDLLRRLSELGAPKVALTGISFEPSTIGVYYYDSTSDDFFYYTTPRIPKLYHGTGDLFASVSMGCITRGMEIKDALSVACEITYLSMKYTMQDPHARFYGVNFEYAITDLVKAVNEKITKKQ